MKPLQPLLFIATFLFMATLLFMAALFYLLLHTLLSGGMVVLYLSAQLTL